jgi:hypothetical protein
MGSRFHLSKVTVILSGIGLFSVPTIDLQALASGYFWNCETGQKVSKPDTPAYDFCA